MLPKFRRLFVRSTAQYGCLSALVIILCLGNLVANDKLAAPEGEPLILEVSIGDIRQDIRLAEESDFFSVTDTALGRLTASGHVGKIRDGRLQVNVKTFWLHHGGSGAGSGGNVQQIQLGQIVTGLASMPSPPAPAFWIRRGVDPVPTLVAALRRRDANAIFAASRLGDLGSTAVGAVTELTTVLADETARLWLRERAAEALGKIGGPAIKAVPRLAELIQEQPPDPLRVAAALALWQIAKHPDATSSLVDAVDAADRVVRVKALEALAEIAVESPGVGQKMVAHLKDRDGKVRAAAAYVVWLSDRDERSVDVLIEMLDRRLKGYQAAIEPLGKIGYPAAHRATPALAAVALESDRSWRRAVADVLARVDPGARKTLPCFLDVMGDKDGTHLHEASEVLAAMVPSVLPAIHGLLEQEGEPARRLALSSLGHMGLPALGALAEALRHEDPAVRENAANELRELLYREVGRGSFPDTREENRERLHSLRATVAPALRALVLALDDDVHEVRVAAAFALSDAGPPAIPAVTAALESDDPRVRERAARIIKHIRAVVEMEDDAESH